MLRAWKRVGLYVTMMTRSDDGIIVSISMRPT